MSDNTPFARHDVVINGLVRAAIEFSVLFVVYFLVIGRDSNVESAGMFYAVFFLIAVICIPPQVLLEYESRMLDLDTEANANTQPATEAPQPLPNPWLPSLPYALPCAFLGAPLIYFALVNSVGLLTVVSVVSVISALMAASVILWLVFDRHMAAVFRHKAGSRARDSLSEPGEDAPISPDDYYITRHMLPWGVCVSLVGFLVIYKYIRETMFDIGTIEPLTGAFFVGSTCFTLCIWCWYESSEQMKHDLEHGLIKEHGDHDLSSTDLVFLFNTVAAVAVGCLALSSWLLPGIFSSSWVWQWVGVFFCIAAGLAGNFLGIMWSTRRVVVIKKT